MPETFNTDLDSQERALHYGDGLFETLLKFNHDLPHWTAHYDRLCRGCARLSIPAPPERWLRTQVERECVAENSVVKIIVSRGRGGRGVALPTDLTASVFVCCYPWSEPEVRELETSICRTRLPLNPNLAGLKHLNRLDYVLAALELEHKPGLGEGLLCDTEGFLVEGIVSNLFFVDREQVYTPSLELAGVAGIMRHLVLEHLEKQKIPTRVGRYHPQMLLDASECFLCNSVRGVSPVIAVDQREYAVGDITASLMAALNIPEVIL